MGLYNTIFGESDNAAFLLKILGLTRSDIYRYRDCYLSCNNEIAVYTRGGGGNRECYCDTKEDDEGNIVHESSCVIPIQEQLRKHKLYLYDKDDKLDRTYATFYFKLPYDLKLNIEPEQDRNTIWSNFLDALVSLTSNEFEPETIEQEFKECVEEFTDQLRPSWRAWRTLIRVKEYDASRKIIHMVIPAWDVNQTVQLQIHDVPSEIQDRILNGYKYFHAQVNLGAETCKDLYFIKWEPE